jgi:hypothetical protein
LVHYKLGEPCSDNEECARGLACQEKHCAKSPTGAGHDPREHRNPGACAKDAECAGDRLCVYGVCRASTLSLGQKCQANEDCDDPGACIQGKCQPRRRGQDAALSKDDTRAH